MRRDTLSTGRWWLTGLGLSVLFPVAAAAWASAADRSARVRAPETRAHRKQPKGLAVRIVYDNYPFDKKLQTAWGFACVVTGLEKAILFDTGGDGRILLANMRACGMEPGEIDAVVLSHIHGDHTGGLGAFLEANSRVTVYVPKVFPEGVKREVRKMGASVVETDAPSKICSGARTTGVLDGGIPEQELYLKGPRGLIVITGCAHPGIVEIVKAAKAHAGTRPDTVMGGFHMAGVSQSKVQSVIQAFKDMGVAQVAPSHCSGDGTRKQMKEAFGEGYLPAGAGARFTFESGAEP